MGQSVMVPSIHDAFVCEIHQPAVRLRDQPALCISADGLSCGVSLSTAPSSHVHCSISPYILCNAIPFQKRRPCLPCRGRKRSTLTVGAGKVSPGTWQPLLAGAGQHILFGPITRWMILGVDAGASFLGLVKWPAITPLSCCWNWQGNCNPIPGDSKLLKPILPALWRPLKILKTCHAIRIVSIDGSVMAIALVHGRW